MGVEEMDGRRDGCMGGCVDGCLDEIQTYGTMELMSVWVDGQMDGMCIWMLGR